MNTLKLFLLAIFVCNLPSCIEDDKEYFSAGEEIVFQFEYLNYAWGKQHHGFLIAPDGTKYSYNNPENWVFRENNQIKAEDFINNLAVCVNEGKVDTDELNRMKALVLKVDETQLTEPENTMYDAGSESYSFYVKDVTKGTYRQVILLNRGDWSQENKDKDAKEIAGWLMQLNNGGIFKD
ncbi:MAG: hypothetical protein RBS73_00505 [Prolixibacteraceae bacterium]|jgi:hypothetical protein|nr:hypothetical protein [Prolixibacteraceae bacterium]